jgi:aspartate carbamoyltransferase regulatory subunit
VEKVFLYFSISDPTSPTLILSWRCPYCKCISKEPLSVEIWLKSPLPVEMKCENCNQESGVAGFITGSMPEDQDSGSTV